MESANNWPDAAVKIVSAICFAAIMWAIFH